MIVVRNLEMLRFPDNRSRVGNQDQKAKIQLLTLIRKLIRITISNF